LPKKNLIKNVNPYLTDIRQTYIFNWQISPKNDISPTLTNTPQGLARYNPQNKIYIAMANIPPRTWMSNSCYDIISFCILVA